MLDHNTLNGNITDIDVCISSEVAEPLNESANIANVCVSKKVVVTVTWLKLLKMNIITVC